MATKEQTELTRKGWKVYSIGNQWYMEMLADPMQVYEIPARSKREAVIEALASLK